MRNSGQTLIPSRSAGNRRTLRLSPAGRPARFAPPAMLTPPKKKKLYSVPPPLRRYLADYTREVALPVDYDSLTHYSENYPLLDRDGRDTLWRTVTFPPAEARDVYKGLRDIYALLRS